MQKLLMIPLCLFAFQAKAQTYQPFTSPGGLSLSTKIGTTSQTISDLMSLANKALPAKNGIRTGGSDTNTDISAAYADSLKNTVSTYLSPKTSRPRYIFFGGADNFQLAANIPQPLIDSGKVALYEHANGVAPLTAAYRQSIQTTFAPTGSQLVAGGGNAMGEISLTTDAGYLDYFNGKYPIEDNTDISGTGTFTEPDGTVLSSFYTADDLSKFKAGVDSIIPYGAKNIAPVVAPNSFDAYSLGTDFATDGYWANTRAAALYGGAIAIDTPPSYALHMGEAYIKAVVSEIKWGLANHLRVTLLVSPYNINGPYPDPEVWNSTASYIDLLIRNDAIPTSYVVLTYCGCTNTNPLTGSTYLSGSMDHMVQMLLSAPVSPPGTAVPQSTVAGGVSEADAFSPININHTVDSMNTSPTYAQKLGDINPANSGTNIIGSLGYQSASDVLIQSGKIGTNLYSDSVLDVFLSPSSSFLTQTPLTFQGGNGNPELTGSSDSNLHLTDPYQPKESIVGLAFGTTSGSPSIANDGDNHITLSASNGFLFNDSVTFQGNAGKGNQVLSENSNNALLNINNPYNTDTMQTGISLGSSAAPPYLSLDATGTSLMMGNGSIFMQGNTFDYKTAGTKNGQNGYVQTWNQAVNGEIDLIDYHGTGSGGMNWYNYDATSNSIETLMSLNASTLTVSGNIIAGGAVQLYSESKSAILAISSPTEGQIVNDSTDHVPVIYENGKWYPLTLGTALTQ